MLLAMSFRPLISAPSTVVLACALALACVASTGCKKDGAADGDAAADAAVADAAVADAADAAVADAAVDAAAAPLTTTVAPVPVGKPKLTDPPICQSARSARQRKSPAAPGLERQCIAAGGTM